MMRMFFKRAANLQTKAFLENGITRHTSSFRRLSTDSYEYQFLEQSKIPTLHFQKSLPKLPLPQLEKTCERYLTALKPILTENEFSDTEKLVKNFKEKEGKYLHEEVRRNDILNHDTSYISKPWFDMYLCDRSPLPINYNPVLIYNNSKQSDNNDQIVKASNILISSLRFLRSLQKNILTPDVYHLNPKKSDTDFFRTFTRYLPSSVSWYGAYLLKAFPLDMSQYPNLFNSTRIPKLNKDVIFKDGSAKHILVLRKGHFFVFDVLDNNGNILPPEDIYTCLKYISDKNLERNLNYLGYFTTENRDNWAKSREYIISKCKENFESLSAIDSSLFVLCLDDEVLGSDMVALMKNFLHGYGFNRWFDKSFSILISKDAAAAINFEHSWGDGVAVLRYFQDVYKDTNANLFVHSNMKTSNIDAGEFVRELHFELDGKILNDVKVAKEKFEEICKSLTVDIAKCEKFGKAKCKTSSISPDSVMQLAFQAAYHKVYGNFVSTYESCSTAAFKHGRTETIRPCTDATKEFAMSLNRKNRPGNTQLVEMMKKCSSVHGNLTKEAAMGEGFDRHLFAMKDMCLKIGNELPELFTHGAYKRINYNILSTSTLSSDAVIMGGFGPVVPDGLGIGYVIKNDMCGAVISSYAEKRNGSEFADALELTFDEIHDIIC